MNGWEIVGAVAVVAGIALKGAALLFLLRGRSTDNPDATGVAVVLAFVACLFGAIQLATLWGWWAGANMVATVGILVGIALVDFRTWKRAQASRPRGWCPGCQVVHS